MTHHALTRSTDSPPTLVALFFFNDPTTTEIYTLSLHDALPISGRARRPSAHAALRVWVAAALGIACGLAAWRATGDRKSTRLNSSHSQISYAVFCLKKKTHIKSLKIKCVQYVDQNVYFIQLERE